MAKLAQDNVSRSGFSAPEQHFLSNTTPDVMLHTMERDAFVQGLFNELNDQIKRYKGIVHQLSELKARVMIVERNLRLTREHLRMVLGQTEEEVPTDWEKKLDTVKFVGTRLGDACVEIMRTHKKLPMNEIVKALNNGQFRFRTSTPLREINAALLRQPYVKREGEYWVYKERDTKEKWGAKL